MCMRSDAGAELRKRSIAVAFADIAENLIVGAILFCYINDMLDRSWPTGFRRNRVAAAGVDEIEQVVAIRRVSQHGARVLFERIGVEGIDDGRRTDLHFRHIL